MKNILKKGLIFTMVAFIAIVISGANVYAENVDDDFSKDSSGNWFGAGQLVDIATKAAGEVPNELFLAGYDVRANEITIGGSAFVAGNDVSVKGSTVDGSIFAAGNNVSIDSAVDNNIWAAGQTVTLGENTSVKGLHVAAATVEAKGTYGAVDIGADTVYFDAVVDGDASINAEHVTIGPNASVSGKFSVTSVNEPAIDKAAKVDNLEFKQLSKATDGEDMGEAGVNPSAKNKFFDAIKNIIFNIVKYVILGMLFLLVFGKNLEKSYEYSMKRPGAFWGFGFLSLIVTPIIAILLCITAVGLPIAGLGITLYVLALVFSRTFMFASLVRNLIFTHTSKRLNPYLEVAIAIMIGVIIKEIPILGGIVGFVGIVYTIGYVTLATAEAIKSNRVKKVKAVEETVETEETVSEQ